MSLYSAGVEYGIHCLLWLVDERGDSREASVRDLAELQGVSVEYLAKVFTKLAKAKLVVATEGVRGGFRLNKPSYDISILDVVTAIDGRKMIFDCREIRGRCAVFGGSAPGWALDGMCGVHSAMMTAQLRMEDALGQQTILDLARRTSRKAPNEFGQQVREWFDKRRDIKSSSEIAVTQL
jgi:Rrf2 family protein